MAQPLPTSPLTGVMRFGSPTALATWRIPVTAVSEPARDVLIDLFSERLLSFARVHALGPVHTSSFTSAGNEILIAYVQLARGSSFPRALHALKTVADSSETVPEGAAFDDAKARIVARVLEASEGPRGRSMWLARSHRSAHPQDDLLGYTSKLIALAPQDVELASAWVRPSAGALMTLNSATAQIDAEPRANRTTFAEVDEPDAEDSIAATNVRWRSLAPRVRSFTLSNGLVVRLAPMADRPLAQADLVYPSGWGDEPLGKRGLAELALAAGKVRPTSEAGELLGGRVAFSRVARFDHSIVSVAGFSADLTAALRSLAAIQRQPASAADSSLDQSAMQAYVGAEAAPGVALGAVLNEALFGTGTPCATPVTVASMRSITSADIDGFRERHFRGAGAELLVSGGFDPAAVEQQIRWSFLDDSPGKRETSISCRPRVGESVNVIVARAGKPQLHVVLVLPFEGGWDDHTAARMVLAELLRRRVWRLRSALGATYGFDSELSSGASFGDITVSGLVDEDRAGVVMQRLQQTLADIVGEPSPDLTRDVEVERNRLYRKLLVEASRPAMAARQLRLAATVKRDVATLDRVYAAIPRVDASTVNALAKTQLSPRNRIWVLEGNSATCHAAYESLGVRPDFEVTAVGDHLDERHRVRQP